MFLLILLPTIGAFQLGIRISEVKTSMIYNIDDIGNVKRLKKAYSSKESLEISEYLKDKYIWRYTELRKAYDASLFKPFMKLDKDVENGFKYFEDQIK